MKELRSCDGPISGEHLLTESILLLLQEEADFSISGLPSVKEGESKIISPKGLTTNCLYKRHNSALSPLDDAAHGFFAALKSAMNGAPARDYLFSGHNIERWMLKTVKALAVSGNLARGRQRLLGMFAGNMELVAMLGDPAVRPDEAGLYCPLSTGDLIEHDRQRVQLAPYTDERDNLNGMYLNLMGLKLDLLLTAPAGHEARHRHVGNFRPGSIVVEDKQGTSRVLLSW